MKNIAVMTIMIIAVVVAAFLAGCAGNGEVEEAGPVIQDLSPSDGETRTDTCPVISCSFSSISGIDVTEVSLTVDGADVTSLATITETHLIYTPEEPLSYDIHEVNVDVSDMAGESTQVTWRFTTTERVITAAGPSWFHAGESTSVTITAHIYPDKDLIPSEVKLLRLNELYEITDDLGYLSDDGEGGDAEAGDNIYTIQPTFTEGDVGQILLQISANYRTDLTNTEDVYVGPPIIIFVLPSVPEVAPPSQEGSLRLMTFNTQFLSFAVRDTYGMSNADRALLIANRIKALEPSPDIIVLNEVFSDLGDPARPVLIKELGGTYPYIVPYLGTGLPGQPGIPEDSGLMLFSRYKFTALPYTKHLYDGDPCACVAYKPFLGSASGVDLLSSKGVGLVRIELGPGRYASVAFTHLQASYSKDTAEEALERAYNRAWQLLHVQDIIAGSLGTVNPETELVFVMGDFNIDGNPKSMEHYWGELSGKPQIESDDCYYHEWEYHFSRYLQNSIFATDFSDSWRYDTVSCTTNSTTDDPCECDPGQTHGGYFPLYYHDFYGQRLDYILHNNNQIMASAADIASGAVTQTRYLIQHIRRVWEPVMGLQQQLSDHLAVMADVNVYAPYCNPLIARPVQLSSSKTDEYITDGKITNKENMQWYRVDGEGQGYSIKTSSNVKFDVYEAKDLSRPIRDTGEETRWGKQYIAEPPFYIRVLAADPSATPDYTIDIHLHLGRDKEDAIPLEPLQVYPNLKTPYSYGYLYQMPEVGPINDDNIVWFMIMPEIGDTGTPPSMKAIVDSFEFDPLFDLRLVQVDEHDNVTVIAESHEVDYPYDEHPTVQSVMSREELGGEVEDETYYLQVHSEYPGNKGQYFILHWQTSLTWYLPGELRCIEQQDSTGDDDILAWVQVDGINIKAGSNAIDLGWFDDGGGDCDEYESRKNALWAKYKFASDMYIQLVETDGVASPNYLGYRTFDKTLPMNVEKCDVVVEWLMPEEDDPDNKECDPKWHYRLVAGTLYHVLPG